MPLRFGHVGLRERCFHSLKKEIKTSEPRIFRIRHFTHDQNEEAVLCLGKVE